MTGSSLRIFADAAAGQFDKAMADATHDLGVASMKSAYIMADVATAAAKANARANGFSGRWANTLTSKVYPDAPGMVSIQPSVLVYDRILYSNIFEDGGSITGHPMLWLPLKDAPAHIGRQRVTPALFVERVGPLFTIKRDGKPPLLAARSGGNQRGPRGGLKVRMVPMFVGIDAVTLRDRLQIREAVEKAAEQWPEIFASVFNGD